MGQLLTVAHQFKVNNTSIEACLRHAQMYTFFVKSKWRTVVFWFFVTCFSAEAYLRMSPPQGHSTVGF